MKIMYFETGKLPKIMEVENELKQLQNLVDGYIETFRISNNLIVICNDEGKLLGLSPNAIINGELIVGNFFICRLSYDDFESLTDEDIDFICEKFGIPKL